MYENLYFNIDWVGAPVYRLLQPLSVAGGGLNKNLKYGHLCKVLIRKYLEIPSKTLKDAKFYRLGEHGSAWRSATVTVQVSYHHQEMV